MSDSPLALATSRALDALAGEIVDDLHAAIGNQPVSRDDARRPVIAGLPSTNEMRSRLSRLEDQQARLASALTHLGAAAGIPAKRNRDAIE